MSNFHFDLSLKLSQGEVQKLSGEVQNDLRGGAHLPTPPLEIRPCLGTRLLYRLSPTHNDIQYMYRKDELRNRLCTYNEERHHLTVKIIWFLPNNVLVFFTVTIL